MTIDLDVAVTAKHFGIDAALIQAVLIAEGNIVKAVSISVPSILQTPKDQQRQQAIEITCRSAVHAMSDFLQSPASAYSSGPTLAAQFVDFWAKRWAPVGVANDPHGLNSFWSKNVMSAWHPPATT